jgi:hypothetical protein
VAKEVNEEQPKKKFGLLKLIGIGLILFAAFSSGFDHFRQVAVKVAGMESEISEQTKKDALYELSAINSKLKTKGAITDKFSKLESDNVQKNMDSKRAIALGVMSLMGGDLRSVSAPTNGLMQLEHSNEFYKSLMADAGTEYTHLKEILQARTEKIKQYEMFMADPVNRWFAGWAGYPKINLKNEKAWTILTGFATKTKTTGVADPVNPLGKNAEIAE